MGLIDTVSLFGSVVLAIPIGLLGVELLVFDGRPVVGAAFLGLAAALVAGQYYLPGLKDELAGGVASVVLGDVGEPDPDPNASANAGSDSDANANPEVASADADVDERGE